MDVLNDIAAYLPSEMSDVLLSLNKRVFSSITEIRLRRKKQIVIVVKNHSYFLQRNGDISDRPTALSLVCSDNWFDQIFMQICDYSLYSKMSELKRGYVTLPCGGRVGVTSTAVFDDEHMMSVKDIMSLNFRIPRPNIGCSKNLLDCLYINSFPSIIVVGKPNSGKTTLLRDMARQLADGYNGVYRKIAIIDERNEFAGKENCNYTLDVGTNTDVLTGFDKANGIEIATRTLSPEMIICDEISTNSELQSILYSFSSGVRFALSVHIGDRADLFRKPIIRDLLLTGEFGYIVMLDEYTYSTEILDGTDVLNEINRRNNTDIIHNGCGTAFV